MERNKIFTKKGEEILVDEEDFDYLSQRAWHVNFDGHAQSSGPRDCNGKQSPVKMHRVIMKVTDPKVHVDHKNLNKLDNRKSNLRLCNPSQNQANIRVHTRNKAGLKGVRRRKDKYEAYIWHGKSLYLGTFSTKEAAHEAYVKAAIKYFGEFARAK